MPLNASTYLTTQGWKGKGTSLDGPNGNGLKKPLVITQKKTLGGIGKDRDRAVEWWDCLFEASAKSIKITANSTDSKPTTPSSLPVDSISTSTSTPISPNDQTSSSEKSHLNSNTLSGGLSLISQAKRDHAKRVLMSGFVRGEIIGTRQEEEILSRKIVEGEEKARDRNGHEEKQQEEARKFARGENLKEKRLRQIEEAIKLKNAIDTTETQRGSEKIQSKKRKRCAQEEAEASNAKDGKNENEDEDGETVREGKEKESKKCEKSEKRKRKEIKRQKKRDKEIRKSEKALKKSLKEKKKSERESKKREKKEKKEKKEGKEKKQKQKGEDTTGVEESQNRESKMRHRDQVQVQDEDQDEKGEKTKTKTESKSKSKSKSKSNSKSKPKSSSKPSELDQLSSSSSASSAFPSSSSSTTTIPTIKSVQQSSEINQSRKGQFVDPKTLLGQKQDQELQTFTPETTPPISVSAVHEQDSRAGGEGEEIEEDERLKKKRKKEKKEKKSSKKSKQ